MITQSELENYYFNSALISKFNKILLKLKIIKINSYRKRMLDERCIEFNLRFNYWNPLTYFYIFIVGILVFPPAVWREGGKHAVKLIKTELTDGFYEWNM